MIDLVSWQVNCRIMNEELKKRLIALKDKDLEMRSAILRKGGLYEGYDENMESLHIKNAEILDKIIKENGWPGISLVGDDGARAAFLIAQHAISKPDLQRLFLSHLKTAVMDGEASPLQAACLEDRILFNEGKPCLYGMLFDWDESGNLVANVDDESAVNDRRKALGLDTLAEALQKHRKEIEEEGGGPPSNIQEHKKKAKEWAERVGWQRKPA